VRAAVLEHVMEPLSICSGIALPNLKTGQVLVSVAYSGVCRSQLMEVKGLRGEDRFLPHLLGHEGTGVVRAVGEGVTRVSPGDWVVIGWIKGAGLDGGGVHYLHGQRIINAGAATTFNEQGVVSENRLVKLPAGVPADLGVLFGCAVPTGAGIIMNSVKPAAASTVAVVGLGGIGLSALMALRLFSCKTIIAADTSSERLAIAREFGAAVTIDSSKANLVAEIRALTGGSGADYVVEAAGQAETIEQAFEATRRGGLCVFASHPENGRKISIDPYELICGKRIVGSWGGQCKPDEAIPLFGDLYRKGLLPLERLVKRRYRLEQINDALKDLEDREVLRPLIEVAPGLWHGSPR
jgi:S-(hydroxymethyl)glutathione dehydrogenase / alcohol dehydrogenase